LAHAPHTRFEGFAIVEQAHFEFAQSMDWSDIRMLMRYTHATGDACAEQCNC
jgi:hypothetical protein